MDEKLYLAVLKYLGYRPRSEKEISEYLKKKIQKLKDTTVTANAEAIIKIIIAKLTKQKFLNDEEFARMWVRSRTSYRQKGRRLIQMELKQKGITQEIIEKVLTQSHEEFASDLENAIQILERKRKRFETMDTQERFNKAGSMLARRGFDLDIIRKSIDSVFGK